MTSTNPPKDDRIGNDYHEGTNPNPGGDIDTGDSAIPPYEGRSTGSDERYKGTLRAMGDEPPLREPNQPQSSDREDLDQRDLQAPDGVGESLSRRGEDVVEDDGKEAGRVDTGTHEGPTDRPTGESTSRDRTSVDPT